MAFAAGGVKQISRQSTEPARQKTKNFPAPNPLPFPSAGRRGKTVNAKNYAGRRTAEKPRHARNSGARLKNGQNCALKNAF